MENIKGKTFRGLIWSAISTLGTQLSSFTLGVILARLVSPAEFGLVQIALVFVGYANMLLDFGFGTALVQRKNITERDLSSAFWLNLGLGAICVVLISGSAPFIADFYQQPSLREILWTLSAIFLLVPVIIIQKALAERELDMKRLTVANLLSIFGSTSIAIVMAFIGWGVWSLVWQAVLQKLIYAGYLWVRSSWKPRRVFDKTAIKSMMGLSLGLLLNQGLERVVSTLDNLIVGKRFGEAQLGLYARSYALMLLPVGMITGVLTRVMFSSLSIIQDDKERVANIFLRIIGMILFISAPMMIGLYVLCEPAILLLYGEKWRGMVPLMEVFCFMGIFASINALTDNIIISQGDTRRLMWATILEKPVMMLLIVGGSYYDTLGVTYGLLIGAVWIFIFKTYLAGATVGLSMWRVVKRIAPIAICTSIMYGALWLLKQQLPANLLPIWTLAIAVPIGAAVYGASAYVLRVKPLLEAIQMGREKFLRKK